MADGTTVHPRAIRPDDGPRLADLFRSWLPDSLALRFSASVDAAYPPRPSGPRR